MIYGVLLAAGDSSRFGRDKLLSELPDGTPVAVAAARVLLKGVDSAIAVVREDDGELAVILRHEGMEIVQCPVEERGMGISLKTGVGAIPDAMGWVIALADMPFIAPATVCLVTESLKKGASIAVPYYRERRGHPVGFGRLYQNDLMMLHGDRGAAEVLERHFAQILKIECEDPAIHVDIDFPDDLGWVP